MSQKANKYSCTKCGSDVKVVSGHIIRDCECNEGVSVNLSATVYGESKVK